MEPQGCGAVMGAVMSDGKLMTSKMTPATNDEHT